MRPSAATMKVSHPRRQNGMCQRPKVSPSARRRRHGALHALLPFFSTERNSEDVGDHGCSCDGAGDAPWNSFPPGTPCFLNGAITPPRTFAQHTIFAANLTFPDKLGAAGPSNSVPRRENPHRPHADLRWRGGRALVCAAISDCYSERTDVAERSCGWATSDKGSRLSDEPQGAHALRPPCASVTVLRPIAIRPRGGMQAAAPADAADANAEAMEICDAAELSLQEARRFLQPTQSELADALTMVALSPQTSTAVLVAIDTYRLMRAATTESSTSTPGQARCRRPLEFSSQKGESPSTSR